MELQAELLIPLLRATEAGVTAISKRSQAVDEILAGWEILEIQWIEGVLAARQIAGKLSAIAIAEA